MARLFRLDQVVTSIGIGIGLGVGSNDTPSFGAEALAVFAAFTTPPAAARKTLINNAINLLKNTGVWAKLDVLVLTAAADSQAALINWKNPGTFNGSLLNAPAFAADRGFTGNIAATAIIDSTFNPGTAPTPNFVQNSASAFGWSRTSGQLPGALLGDLDAQTTRLMPRFTDDNTYMRVNTTTNTALASLDGSGLWVVNRSGASATQLYRNGSSVGTDTTSSAAVDSAPIKIMDAGTFGVWEGQCAGYGFGASLSAQNNADLYNALLPYMNSIGAA